jgi:hypothetical protein
MATMRTVVVYQTLLLLIGNTGRRKMGDLVGYSV